MWINSDANDAEHSNTTLEDLEEARRLRPGGVRNANAAIAVVLRAGASWRAGVRQVDRHCRHKQICFCMHEPNAAPTSATKKL